MSNLIHDRVCNSSNSAVDFSVVIPTFDRPESVERLLESLLQLDYPTRRFEVIIVDDGSPIPAESRLARFRDSLDLTLLRQNNGGPARARNYGANVARGRYLALTDDDCIATSAWLSEFAHTLERSGDVVCGGRTVNHLPDDLYAEATQALAEYLSRHYNPEHTVGAFFPTNNFAVPREGFLELGGFDESLRFGEDRDLCYRWACSGRKFAFSPRAVIRHAHALNLVSFHRLHFNYGVGTYHFRRKSAEAGRQRVRISPPGWYVSLVLSGFRKERGARGLALSVLLAASQAASASGLLWAKLRRGGDRTRPKQKLRPSRRGYPSYSPDRT
ncbi:MAG: glycosyltransferase [Bryobacteraceae bacterium]|nr:glycosyltransferase [Bryobacteraceae bacterium]